MLWLTRDPTAKLLIFSTWADVLDLMAHALSFNSVPYAYSTGSKKFDTEMTRFRYSQPAMDLAGRCELSILPINVILCVINSSSLHNINAEAPWSLARVMRRPLARSSKPRRGHLRKTSISRS